MMQTDTQPALFTPFRFSAGERRIFAMREPLTVSQWAERYRAVPIGAHRGPWRNDISPHLRKIMDTWAQPHIREVIICKSPQTGGSEAMLCCMAYAMDYHPGMMMVIMPSEAMAKKVNADRIIPMILESPRLLSLISPNPDDMAKNRIKLQNGTLLYTAWANSSSALATFPVRYLFFDETDKYPPFVGQETDPITLGEKRARTFRYTYKIFKVSTPTSEDGPIWKAWNQADVQYQYHVECPECGDEQPMTIDGLKWPSSLPSPLMGEGKGEGGITPEDIRREHLAFYECRSCQAQWTDIIKEKAVRLGKWIAVKGEGIERPRSVAFHLPAWISPDISLSEIASAYLKAKKDRAKLIDFYNDYLAEPYVEKHSERKEDHILALCDERPRGLVPKNIACLTAAVDTQARGFYFEVRAWGYDQDLESWLVREGFVENFTGLIKVLHDDIYKDSEGNEHKIILSLIDSGGGMGDFGVSRTAEVYDFCRRFRNVSPIKGMQRMSQSYRVSQLDVYPGTNKPIPGGLKLYILNVTFFKDYLASKLSIAPADPGAWHLHQETSTDYARQMTAEYKDERGLWQCPPRKQNHYWDCGVYNIAAAEIIGIKYIKNPVKEEQRHEPQQQQTKKARPVKTRRW